MTKENKEIIEGLDGYLYTIGTLIESINNQIANTPDGDLINFELFNALGAYTKGLDYTAQIISAKAVLEKK